MKTVRNLLGTLLVTAGICMIVFSVWFLLRYRTNTRDMADNAEELLRELDKVIPDEPASSDTQFYKDADSMPAIDIRGISCIGKLSVPTLDLELPVANSGSDIGFTPIHISGTPNSTDFVIEALGYSSQFGDLSQLKLGDNIIFTDLFGVRYSYEITGIVSGTMEQLQAMDDAMLQNADSSVAAMTDESAAESAEESKTETIQLLPGVETVTGGDSGNEKEEAETEKQRPELLLKFRKSIRTYVRVACLYREEENKDQ